MTPIGEGTGQAPHVSAGVNTPSANMAPFISANSQSAAERLSPAPDDQSSPADRTGSPCSPSGLTARIEVDPQGNVYLVEVDTGLQIDLRGPDGAPLAGDLNAALSSFATPPGETKMSTSVSDVSDYTPGSSAENLTLDSDPYSLVNALLDGLNPNSLSLNQRGMLTTLKGTISTSRDRLLNTTSVVINQRKDYQETRSDFREFRDITAAKFIEFGKRLDEGHSAIENLVQTNARALEELGETEANIGRLLESMGATPGHSRLPNPVLPFPEFPVSNPINDQLMSDINHVLPPRHAHESSEEFDHRTRASAESKRRAAVAFALPAANLTDSRAGAVPSESAQRTRPSTPKNVQVEESESISSAPRFRQATDNMSMISGANFGPAISGLASAVDVRAPILDALEEFSAEAENVISAIIACQVGESLDDLSSRIRTPKLDPPPKYPGSNDHVEFLNWTEGVTTWMRASFMGGPGTADRYRITVLKTLLTGSALQWFLDYVETRTGQSVIPYDFPSIMCALHRQFVTAATAQRATRKFDAVRYKADEGPLKLMDELVDCSSRLRELMPEFIIRQRFLRLLPENIRGVMALHRQITAEYSTMVQLRYLHEERTHGRPSTAVAAIKSSVLPVPRVNTNARREVTVISVQPPSDVRPTPGPRPPPPGPPVPPELRSLTGASGHPCIIGFLRNEGLLSVSRLSVFLSSYLLS
ncbi:hypothetical protein B0H11DRAFT_2257720 [Mycena galericulata]|nr:hypothetical protein B0H11DRAFT_2257720 [Mycena galericulata]